MQIVQFHEIPVKQTRGPATMTIRFTENATHPTILCLLPTIAPYNCSHLAQRFFLDYMRMLLTNYPLLKLQYWNTLINHRPALDFSRYLRCNRKKIVKNEIRFVSRSDCIRLPVREKTSVHFFFVSKFINYYSAFAHDVFLRRLKGASLVQT